MPASSTIVRDGAAATPIRHLRPRGAGGVQPTTTVELFFDLVYVFAVTQLSHQILDDLSVTGVARAAFLLLVVWWAWIYTTWMANWFDPTSSAVLAVLTAVMLASLLMAAALPGAVTGDGVLFAGIIATAVGNDLLIAHPREPLDGAGVAMMLGGPLLYLLGESLFRRRMGGPANVERLAVAALFVALIPVGDQLSAVLLSAIVAALLTALAVRDLRAPDIHAPARVGWGARWRRLH